MRAGEWRETGDLAGRTLWFRVLGAVKELLHESQSADRKFTKGRLPE
jgi:hypothetical protein